MVNINKIELLDILDNIKRIALALEEANTIKINKIPNNSSPGYLWINNKFEPIDNIQSIPFENLINIDYQKDSLFKNIKAFSEGQQVNDALLWGAKGCGKSSLVRAVVSKIQKEKKENNLAIIDLDKNSLQYLPIMLLQLAKIKRRFLIYLDDLTFDKDDESYKSLKHTLEGSIISRPENICFVATSNRRHLMERQKEEKSLRPKEAIDEQVSLSDRFGLWLGFHSISQETYLEIVKMYIDYYKIKSPKDWIAQANEWSITRGSRSGRVAQQFANSLLIKGSVT